MFEKAQELLKSNTTIDILLDDLENRYKALGEWYKKPVVFCGFSSYTKKIISYLIDCNIDMSNLFILDETNQESEYLGVRIIPTKNIDFFDSTFLFVLSSNPYLGHYAKLLKNFEHVIPYHLICICDKKFDFLIPRYNAKTILDQMKHYLKYRNFYFDFLDHLSDDKSKNILGQMICFLYTLDRQFCSVEKNVYPPYFDRDLLHHDDYDVFLDCGGYNGDTLKEFIDLHIDYSKYFLFEPDRELILQAKKISDDQRIVFKQIAVSDFKGILKFQKEYNDTGHISENGNIQVECDTLSNLVKTKVSAIKLDIEGAEYSALIGAETIISEQKPKLLVSVYHKCDDIYVLSQVIKKFNPNYKFYLRCCCDSFFTDLILFCI